MCYPNNSFHIPPILLQPQALNEPFFLTQRFLAIDKKDMVVSLMACKDEFFC